MSSFSKLQKKWKAAKKSSFSNTHRNHQSVQSNWKKKRKWSYSPISVPKNNCLSSFSISHISLRKVSIFPQPNTDFLLAFIFLTSVQEFTRERLQLSISTPLKHGKSVPVHMGLWNLKDLFHSGICSTVWKQGGFIFYKCYTLQWSRWVKLSARPAALGMKKLCSQSAFLRGEHPTITISSTFSHTQPLL